MTSVEDQLTELLSRVDALLRGPSAPLPTKSSRGARSRHATSAADEAELAETASPVVCVSQQPRCITGEMRAYQVEGLNWLVSLHDRGISGILADEMGLGKTLQTISLFGYLRFDRDPSPTATSLGRTVPGKTRLPSLVLCPKSTLPNWLREFAMWCPDLRVAKLLGDETERDTQLSDFLSNLAGVPGAGAQGGYDVLVTTYEMCVREKHILSKKVGQWEYIVIDEAHRIKNEQSVLSQVVRLLKSKHRLLLTGTPLNNNLHELWALLNFLLPEVFKEASAFDMMTKEHTNASEKTVRQLQQILRPFLLRRLKSEVETALPGKMETKLFVPMSKVQRLLYQSLLSKDVECVNALRVGSTDRGRLMNLLVQLRKCCNHPYLFDGVEPQPFTDGPHLWEASGKMQVLEKLLKRLQNEQHKVLIFSQMTRVLDILEDFCRIKNYTYCRLDGATEAEARQAQIEAFNTNPDIFIFLLSTRAGGLGINLQHACSRVVIFDSDLNPFADEQAIARVHRLGQTKPVRVFRLVTDRSIEEKIIERAEKKLYLDALVIQGARIATGASLSSTELLTMVRFGADEVFRASHGDGGDQVLTDEDIEKILVQGEQRTEEMKNRLHTSLNFTLENAFKFDGRLTDTDILVQDDKRNPATFTPIIVELGRRERAGPGAAGGSSSGPGVGSAGGALGDVQDNVRPVVPEPKLPKPPLVSDYQFYPRTAIDAAHKKECELLLQLYGLEVKLREAEMREERNKKQNKVVPKDMGGQTETERIGELVEMKKQQIYAVVEDKDRLLSEGFAAWTRRDFRVFVASAEKFGLGNEEGVAREVAKLTGKQVEDVLRYIEVFKSRKEELENWEQVTVRIERGNQKNQRKDYIQTLVQKELARHVNPAMTAAVELRKIGDCWSETPHDKIFFVAMGEQGYGHWDTVRRQFRAAPQVRFDWWARTRSTGEIQNRCERIVKALENKKADDVGLVADPTKPPEIWTSEEAEAEAWLPAAASKKKAVETAEKKKRKKSEKSESVSAVDGAFKPTKRVRGSDGDLAQSTALPGAVAAALAADAAGDAPANAPGVEVAGVPGAEQDEKVEADPNLTEDEF